MGWSRGGGRAGDMNGHREWGRAEDEGRGGDRGRGEARAGAGVGRAQGGVWGAPTASGKREGRAEYAFQVQDWLRSLVRSSPARGPPVWGVSVERP